MWCPIGFTGFSGPGMSHTDRLIENLVRLSGLRRRDDLLSGLTQALSETIDANEVAIFSLVHDKDRRFWLPLTQAAAGSGVRLVSDPMRFDPETIAPMESDVARMQCLNRVEVVVTAPTADKSSYVSRFPMTISEGSTLWGVAETCSNAALSPTDVATVQRLITLYGNMLDMLDYSECDALTGLWNRKPFDDLFYKTFKPTESTQSPPDGVEHRSAMPLPKFWLAMLDIDHFKKVNDTYGHLIGDEVLILVARLMKTTFRAHDKVYRFGGEEFVVVLRSADHDAAVGAIERFRANMEAFAFPQAGRITVSVGVTEIMAGDTPAASCERADQAVYYAKHHGRNQVCSEAELVRRGLLKVDVKVGDIELF